MRIRIVLNQESSLVDLTPSEPSCYAHTCLSTRTPIRRNFAFSDGPQWIVRGSIIMTRLRWGLLIVILAAGIWSTRPWWKRPVAIDDARQLANRPLGDRDSQQQPDAPAANGNAANGAADSPQTSGDSGSIDQAVVPTSASEPLEKATAEEGRAVIDTADANPSAQPQGALAETPSQPAAKPSSPVAIDLLSRIDLERDVVKGDWQFDSGQLSSPPDVNQARVQIPVEPPAEYKLRMVVMRGGHGKYTTLGIGLVGGGRQFYVLLDSSVEGGSLGLDMLDGKSWNQNSSTRRVSVFTDGVPAEVVCTVRESGLSVQVDGREVLVWKGDYSRLSMYRAWEVPNKRQLFLGTDCNYVISQLTLSPLDGSAEKSAAADGAGP